MAFHSSFLISHYSSVSRTVIVKNVPIGGDSPVVIQTMWKDRLTPADLEGEAGRATVERIERLSRMGCGLLRFAVPDITAAETLGRLAGMATMPSTLTIKSPCAVWTSRLPKSV